METCPICHVHVSRLTLEVHVNTCLDRQQLSLVVERRRVRRRPEGRRRSVGRGHLDFSDGSEPLRQLGASRSPASARLRRDLELDTTLPENAEASPVAPVAARRERRSLPESGRIPGLRQGAGGRASIGRSFFDISAPGLGRGGLLFARVLGADVEYASRKSRVGSFLFKAACCETHSGSDRANVYLPRKSASMYGHVHLEHAGDNCVYSTGMAAMLDQHYPFCWTDEFVFAVHEFYGPLCLRVNVLQRNRLRADDVKGHVSLRLSYMYDKTNRTWAKLNDLLCTGDTRELVDRLKHALREVQYENDSDRDEDRDDIQTNEELRRNVKTGKIKLSRGEISDMLPLDSVRFCKRRRKPNFPAIFRQTGSIAHVFRCVEYVECESFVYYGDEVLKSNGGRSVLAGCWIEFLYVPLVNPRRDLVSADSAAVSLAREHSSTRSMPHPLQRLPRQYDLFERATDASNRQRREDFDDAVQINLTEFLARSPHDNSPLPNGPRASSVQCSQPDGISTAPLHAVAALGSDVFARAVLGMFQGSIQPNMYGGRLPHHIACLFGNVRVLADLFDEFPVSHSQDDALPNDCMPDEWGVPLVHYAILGAQLHESSLVLLRHLHDRGLLDDACDLDGNSAFLLLCATARDIPHDADHIRQLAGYLVRKGAQMTRTNRSGDSALIIATRNGDRVLVEWLMQNCPELVATSNNAGRMPVHVAVAHQNRDALQLFTRGARRWAGVYRSPKDAQTPLHIAAELCDVSSMRILLDAIGNLCDRERNEILGTRDSSGSTCFDIARRVNTGDEILKLLEGTRSFWSHDNADEAMDRSISYSRSPRTHHEENSRYSESIIAEDKDYVFAETREELESLRIKGEIVALRSIPRRLEMSRRTRSYASLKETTIALQRERQIHEVASVLQAMMQKMVDTSPQLQTLEAPLHEPVSTATILLKHHRWNTEKLLRSFEADPLRTCLDAGVTLVTMTTLQPAVIDDNRDERVFYCPICMESIPAHETIGLPCGHKFDTRCWKGYLKAKLADGPSCVDATCPGLECRQVVSEEVWDRVYPEDSAERKRWCPAPNCDLAVVYSGIKNDLECSCGFKLCFRCSGAAHSPATCDMMKQWRVHLHQDGIDSSDVYILKSTKPCPRCKAAIDLDSGCNHVTCSCGFEFCWLCAGPWETHGDATGGFYECNLYDPKVVYEESILSSESGRLIHYARRFEHHNTAQDIAAAMRKTYAAMLQRESDSYARLKLTGEVEALDVLVESRRVLKHTYVLAYFLADAHKRHLFEHSQEMLEKHSEYLQELVKPPLLDVQVEVLRKQARLVEKFAAMLLEGVEYLHRDAGSSAVPITGGVPMSPAKAVTSAHPPSLHERLASRLAL